MTDKNKAEEVMNEQVSGFDVDEAVNTKDFLKYMASLPGAKDFDMSNAEEVGRHFEAFNKEKEFKAEVAAKKEEVKKDLVGLYSVQISQEFGLQLTPSDAKNIRDHIERLSNKSPEEILKLADKVKVFQELPAKIKEAEGYLNEAAETAQLDTKLDSLRKKDDDLEGIKEYLGFFGKTKLRFQTAVAYAKAAPLLGKVMLGFDVDEEEVGESRQLVTDLLGKWDTLEKIKEEVGEVNADKVETLLESVGGQIKQIEALVDTIENTEVYKQRANEIFTETRKELFAGISNIAGLKKVVESKISAELREMMKSGSLKSLDEAQKRFEELKALAQTTETGINPFGRNKVETLQKRLDDRAQKVAFGEIFEKVFEYEVGDSPLEELEKALEPILERQKLGSKEGDDVRKFMAEKLQDAGETLDDSDESKMKRWIIARIIIKMKK